MNRSDRIREALSPLKYSLSSLALALFAYGVLSNWACVASSRMFVITPPLQDIVFSYIGLFSTGALQKHIFASLIRVLEGLSLGVPIGVLIGFLMGWHERIDHYVDPIYQMLRPIPPLAFVTLFILWFGIEEFPKVLLIFYSVVMATLIPTYHGVKDIPSVYIKAAQVLGANRETLIRKVILPAASPRILAGVRVSVMMGWGTLVAAELIASSSGLGYLIIDSQRVLETQIVMDGIVTIAILGFIMDAILLLAISRLTRWMKRGVA